MPPVQLLLVVSERRSGSTRLAEELARALPCAIGLGEPMLARASSGGYERHAWAKDLSPALARERNRRPLAWLRHVGAHACAHRPPSACAEGERCVAVLKLLRVAHHLRPSQLETALGAAPDVHAVVLERPSAHAECSLRWAQRRQDWSNSPRERARTGLGPEHALFVRACLATNGSAAYAAAHAAWFDAARRRWPQLHVPFAEAITRTAAVVHRVAAALGVGLRALNAVGTVLPPHADLPPAALALVTIVGRAPEWLAHWQAHHLGRAVAELFVYWRSNTVLADPAADDARVRHYPLSEAAEPARGRRWWRAWRPCAGAACSCATSALVRDAPDDATMCERFLYMPEQAYTLRDAARRADVHSTWLLSLDLDEYLVGDWRAYLRMMQARRRPPGGVRLTQLQMGGAREALAPRRRAALPEQKALVRRPALHADPRAYGSVHDVALAPGEEYVDAPTHLLAVHHRRYRNWSAATNRARLDELDCGGGRSRAGAPAHAKVCADKVQELRRWGLERTRRARVDLLPTGLTPPPW